MEDELMVNFYTVLQYISVALRKKWHKAAGSSSGLQKHKGSICVF